MTEDRVALRMQPLLLLHGPCISGLHLPSPVQPRAATSAGPGTALHLPMVYHYRRVLLSVVVVEPDISKNRPLQTLCWTPHCVPTQML